MRRRYVRFVLVGLFLALFLATGSLVLAQSEGPQDAAAVQAPLGTAFTYQGRLIDGTTPVTGTCDFTFTLYDALSGGRSLGLKNKSGVTVDDGYFTVQLDYGPSPFEGNARYLEIEVDCGSGSTTLTPRQRLTAAPYALHARNAGSTEALQGRTVAGTAPSTGEVLRWNGSAWAPGTVSSSGGGDITAVYSGTGLLGGGESGAVTLHVDFAGSGSANTAARSDHNHAGTYSPTGHDHDARYYTESELQNGTASVDWSALNGVPTGLGDGDDDTTYTAGSGLNLSGTQFEADFAGNGGANTVARSDHHHDSVYQQKYARTVIVSPVGDGSDQAANGTALRNALSGITGAGSSNPYLLKIEPGVYDVGTTALSMTPYVDIEGSGIGVTEIRSTGFQTTTTGTIVAADDAELRELTVTSDGSYQDGIATGIYSDGRIGLRLSRVQIQAWNVLTQSYGIAIDAGGVTLEEVAIESAVASGGAICAGIVNEGGLVTMDDVNVGCTNGSFSVGISQGSLSTGLEMTNVDVVVRGGGSGYGVLNNDASPRMSHVRVEVTGADWGYAVYNGGTSAPTLESVTAISSGSASTGYGLYNSSSATTMTVDRSTVSGDDYSVYATSGDTLDVNIGASRLDGSVSNTGLGTLTCAASYDGSYAALNASCSP